MSRVNETCGYVEFSIAEMGTASKYIEASPTLVQNSEPQVANVLKQSQPSGSYSQPSTFAAFDHMAGNLFDHLLNI